jgi:hemoglobin
VTWVDPTTFPSASKLFCENRESSESELALYGDKDRQSQTKTSGTNQNQGFQRLSLKPVFCSVAPQHPFSSAAHGLELTVVDDFIDRIMVDPRLNANPLVDEAHHRVSPPGFKYLVTEMVCWAAGGPQKYTGRSMSESHKHLKITGGEWDAFMDDFKQTLDKFGVPAQEQNDALSIRTKTNVKPVRNRATSAGPLQ